MTKTEAKDAGINAGNAWANLQDEATLRDEGGYHDRVNERANDEAINMGFRTVDSANAQAFILSFRSAALTRLRALYHELPDVKESRRVEYFDRKLRQGLDDAKAKLEKFRISLDQNPEYAFRWADDAMAAAAALDVYTRLVEVFAKTDVATTRKEAQEEVLHLSRYVSRSTSLCHNAMEQYKLQALATFVQETAFVESL